jgi:hypothetical protein
VDTWNRFDPEGSEGIELCCCSFPRFEKKFGKCMRLGNVKEYFLVVAKSSSSWIFVVVVGFVVVLSRLVAAA